MPSPSYSQSVLSGAQKHGLSPRDLAKAMSLSQRAFAAVLKGKAKLTRENLVALEEATGMSAGQFALLSHDEHDEGISAVMDAWAATRTPTNAPAQTK